MLDRGTLVYAFVTDFNSHSIELNSCISGSHGGDRLGVWSYQGFLFDNDPG